MGNMTDLKPPACDVAETPLPTDQQGTNEQSPAAELAVLQTVLTALTPLDNAARGRVLNYVSSLLKITTENIGHFRLEDSALSGRGSKASTDGGQHNIERFATFADLFDAAGPRTNADKALVAGYWLQIYGVSESFDAQSANKELKHLGHGIENITSALEPLINQKPALVLQLKKSGKSRQARKVYKVSGSGIRAVESLING